MLADRQNSFESGLKQERTKILVQSANGPVLGCSGDSQFIESFFACVREKWDTMNGSSYSRFKTLYGQLLVETYESNKYTGAKTNLTIETMLVEVQDGTLNSFGATGPAWSRSIDCQSIVAIPQEFSGVEPYLRINSKPLHEEEAIKLGEEILRQICFLNHEIGPPEYHGYDFVKITPDCELSLKNVPAKLGRLDPSQLINNVQIKEEGAS